VSLCRWLCSLYPIDIFVVEDSPHPKDLSYNPLKKGKTFFYEKLESFSNLRVVDAEEMASWRDHIGLDKSNSNKTDVAFRKHCIDSWMLAWLETDCPYKHKPTQRDVLSIAPIDIERRVFHPHQDASSPLSYPFKRKALVKHDRINHTCFIGDHPNQPQKGALYRFDDGSLVTTDIDKDRLTFLTFTSFHCLST
jgi:hypothetical protein